MGLVDNSMIPWLFRRTGGVGGGDGEEGESEGGARGVGGKEGGCGQDLGPPRGRAEGGGGSVEGAPL